jgi:glycogen debranching enzyme
MSSAIPSDRPHRKNAPAEPADAEGPAPPPAADFFDAAAEVPYYIPATGPSVRARRTLKHGDSFAVLDAHGDIGASAGGPDGLFHNDTRALSRLELLLNGGPPLLLGSTVAEDNAELSVDLTNADIFVASRLVLAKDTVHLLRTIFLWQDRLYMRIELRNYGDKLIRAAVTHRYDNDFADLFEVRGITRKARGERRPPVVEPDKVTLLYDGLDRMERRTVIAFDPPPTTITGEESTHMVRLPAGSSAEILVHVDCGSDTGRVAEDHLRSLEAARATYRTSMAALAHVETSDDVINRVLRRSASDLQMLVTDTPQGPYPYAGIPWYATTFGRDGLITALMTLWLDPTLSRGVLRRLAVLQANADSDIDDAEPGKILHEQRKGEMARLREVPFGQYYGSVDSTPLFVLLAARYAARTGDRATMEELWPSIVAALHWIDGPGDVDADGFIEYQAAAATGLANQGWKDSHDAVFHRDGTFASGPIALAEVQGYVFAAKTELAATARLLGHVDLADRLLREAAELRRRFELAFWQPELGLYALALDGDKRPCMVQSSNAGQVLFSGIADPSRARRVADVLLEEPAFSGWGIRTIGSGAARYNPMSYHNGSIWPHDNALIALGFAQYQLKGHVDRVFEAIFTAASHMEHARLPELYCGFSRRPARGPTLYPVACSPQAWASAAPFALVQACVGLEFDVAAREIRFRNPRIPTCLNDIVLSNLTLAGANADVALRRGRQDVSIEVLRRRGDVSVTVVL